MPKYCPIVNKKVTYQFCQDCDDKPCLHLETIQIASSSTPPKVNLNLRKEHILYGK